MVFCSVWCAGVCISTQLVCRQRRRTTLSDKVHVRSCCFSKCPHAARNVKDPGPSLTPLLTPPGDDDTAIQIPPAELRAA